MLMTARNRFSATLMAVAVAVALLNSSATSSFAQRGSGDRLPGDVQLEKGPLAADAFEKNALAVLANIAANQRYRNVPEHDGRLLRIITQTGGAKNVIELGSSTGYSGIWFGLALHKQAAI